MRPRAKTFLKDLIYDFRCYDWTFANDKLIFILFKDFDVKNVTLLCDVLWCMLLFNEIFMSENWGVTFGSQLGYGTKFKMQLFIVILQSKPYTICCNICLRLINNVSLHFVGVCGSTATWRFGRTLMEVSAVVVDIACMLIADWENANSTPSNLLLHTQGQQVQTTTHLQQNSHQHHPQTATVTHQWLPLSLGRYKCNIDAAFSNQFQQTGIGEMILKPSCWLKHYISTNFTS